jgi:hypothetical protein
MWSSKWQATVALSMVEAEYVTMLRCAKQMVWMQSWFTIVHALPEVIRGYSWGAIILIVMY